MYDGIRSLAPQRGKLRLRLDFADKQPDFAGK
jgi:hypothetical protein